jgi:hypothetical protein
MYHRTIAVPPRGSGEVAMGIRRFVCRQAHGAMNGMMSMARGMMPGALEAGMGEAVMPVISSPTWTASVR